MSRRFWILSFCGAVHLAAGVGLYASGIWDLERLDGERQLAGLAVLTPPAPSGGPEGLPEVEMKKKKKKEVQEKKIEVKELVQPEVKKEDEKKPELQDDGGGTGGDTKGPGNNPFGNPDDTGSCTIPPCGPGGKDKVVQPPPRKKTEFVAPPTMQHLRIWGDPQIHPTWETKNEILRDGKNRVTGVVQVCISETGAITSVTLKTSTKYPAYDQRLVDGARTWKYRPHVKEGVATPACSFVSFVYTIR